MADSYYEFSQDLPRLYEAWEDYHKCTKDDVSKSEKFKRRRIAYPNLYEVRRSVCVVGRYREAVQDIKSQIASLQAEPFPIESFHVKQPSDVQDGAFLVPKIVLVASHCPGRRLIDEHGDEGQLDWLYDQVVDTGADLMLIYTNLPKKIYPPMRYVIYHPKLNDNVFPEQTIIKDLACDNCLLTLTEGEKLNKMQKNLLKEWLVKPVNETHPVFKRADFLSSVELSMELQQPQHDLATGLSETFVDNLAFTDNFEDPFTPEDHFVLAKEEHPLADIKQKKRRFKFKFRRTPRRNPVVKMTPENELESSVEMDMYNTTGHGAGAMF